ncbi:MAG: hypothetical protein HY979_03270 [Candidatus Magasanikbacteria bacterium]|nr:hypothetical protein [Candidatus Magasanikbacteria bacterium]
MAYLVLISTVLTAIAAFGVGVFSLIRNPKSPVVRLWFALSMAVTLWAVFYLKASSAESDPQALLYLRLVYIGATLIPILFFHFIVSFLYKAKKYLPLLIFGYGLSLLFLILNTSTNYIIKGVRYMEYFGRYEEVTTVGFNMFLLYFFFFAIYAVILLFRDYRRSDGIRRRQIFYIILAAIIGFVGGASNFLTDLTGIYPYGQFVVWLYPLLITYGIFIDEIKIKIKF